TVNHGGGLRKARQRTWANPIHYAHVMGSGLVGGTPIGVHLECGTYSTSREFGHLPVVAGAPDLDAMAVVAEDPDVLRVMIVHRCACAGTIDLAIDLGGLKTQPEAQVLTLAGESLGDENTAEQPERIVPVASTVQVSSGSIQLALPAFSVTRIDLPLTV
ncbi:hypothetical protein LCGC14_2823210, partial [marine sediment metagenome]